MAKILVTGASGFLGRFVLPLLQQAGHEVVAVARRIPPDADAMVNWRSADLLSPGTPATLVRDTAPSHILHLAWCATPGRFWTSRDNLRWLQSSVELLEAALDHGVGRLVAAGSVAEYGPTDGPCDESLTPCRPETLYGICKDSLRRVWVGAAARAGVSAAWARIFHPFGPHEHPDRLVPSVIRALLAGQEVATTDGSQWRNFQHVADVAAAFAALVDHDVRGAVNIVGGEPDSLRTVIERIGAEIGQPSLIRLGARPRPAGDPDVMTGSPGKLVAETPWRPRFGLAEGLTDTITWWRQQTEAAGVGS
jgi:nucleoside-diphosphate-sugar epimerase